MVNNSNKESPLFSIVVIAKNEEKNIERCLKSIKDVFTELKYSYQIILVDSNSTDLTIKKAMDLGIKELKILKITQSNIYNAALGRNIGSNASTGKYLLFLDGDMKLCKDFLLRDLKILTEEKCAGLIGIRDDIILNSNHEVTKFVKNKYNISKLRIARHFGGALLIKREIFNDMEGYRDYINSFEEPELYIRLKSKGYKVYETPEKMIDHYDKPNKKIGKIKSLLFSKRGLGLGQTIRSSFSDRNISYTLTHKPVAQLFIPILLDTLSYLFLILFFLSLNFILVFIFLQLFCLLICILCFDIKKFILSKFLFLPTLFGILDKKEVIFSVQSIK